MDVARKTIFNLDKNIKNIAVGVSGGGDSMALAHMMCKWAHENDVRVHLLTVNHNLRDNAGQEADQVAKFVSGFPKSSHHILTWNFESKPDSAIMEHARNARYDLMAAYCRDNDISILAIAHHGDDNLETFMFRLAKGSGLDGLTGMKMWGNLNNELQIYRPLLNNSHTELIQYCRDNNVQWIEDPSNRDDKYARPRLRKALENEGFDTKRFSKTLIRLSRAHDALDWLVNRAMLLWDGECIDFQMLKTYPVDVQIRVLQKIIAETGDVTHSYPPKLERVEDIIATLKPNKSATLYGCLVSLSKDEISLKIKKS